MSRGQDFDFGDGVVVVDDPFDRLGFDRLASEAPSIRAAITTNLTRGGAEEFSVSDLSDKQEIILSVFLVCSAILSLIGSCTIVFKILRNLYRKQTTTPYDRIILGLSCCDIVASCTFALGPFLLPSDTSQRVWAIGDDSTCQKLGFLTQLSIWAIWYNAMLSFYYLLTVRFQVKRKEFCRKYEIWMHISGAIFFPVTALVGYIGGWYNEEDLAMTCWIGRVKMGCDDYGNNCSAEYGEIIAYIFGALPSVITVCAVIINNAIIYVFIRNSLITRNHISDIENNINDADDNNADDNNADDDNNNESTKNKGEEPAEYQSIQQQKLTKEASIQGFLYVSTFLVTIIPTIVVQILDGSFGFDENDQARIYPLLVLNSIVLPLQGFFNVFIYVRPSYSRFRAAYPKKSTLFVLKQALFDPKIPRMSTTGGRISIDPASSAAAGKRQQHSKLIKKCGSNFSMSLDNILEEAKEANDSMDSGDGAVMKDDNTYSTDVAGERHDALRTSKRVVIESI